MTGHDIDLVDLDLAVQDDLGKFSDQPLARRWPVIAWTSFSFTPSSPAICRFDRFKPMKYKHNTQTRSGW